MGRQKKILGNEPITVSLQNLSNTDEKSFMQSNELIESIFLQPFKEIELKVLCLISKYVNRQDCFESRYLIEIAVKKDDFCKYLNTNPLNFYQQMKILADELTSKKIRIESIEETGRKSFETIVLIPRVACRNGLAIFSISPTLQPYLQHLKRNFTVISLNHISRIGSSHAIKIYQLLKQYQSLGKRSFQVDELKSLLGIGNLYSNNFKDFYKSVLTISKQHIDKNTDLNISITKKKVGRKVESITFYIKAKKTQLIEAVEMFKKEMNKVFSEKVVTYAHQHNFIKRQWITSKKNVEKNKKLFESWKKARIESYDESSTEPIKMLKEQFAPYENNVPNWYINFLEQIF